ncbi:hypothetical protein ACFFKC_21950 [Pseudoduganella danionis]|jgi:hypothetical protein|uniref:Uncharacterized protein n=1 Tax=Pseudoduganella danionis TaxID=1890295 RepID=A0ABW9STA9_9BURK|nr:hypothetical protein [Pseudoduganella danionis]MTW35408.1 hypothetical protein [Pseudoduganella danionis]
MINAIYADMLAIINKHQFEVAKLYPVDLICDRSRLEASATPGASIAWCVGNTHTHIVFLGLEPENNEMVHCFTNLSAGDKFYLIKIGQSDYSFKEVDRKQFADLASTRIPYRMLGTASDFTLYKDSCRLARCVTQRHGSYENVVFKSKITAFESLHKLDRYAVELWCNRKISEASGSVFSKRELDWQESGQAFQLQAA